MRGLTTLMGGLVFVAVCGCTQHADSVYAVGGKLDLRAAQMDATRSFALHGEWLLYAHRLVALEELRNVEPDLIVANPRNLTGLQIGNSVNVSAQGVATLALTIRLAEGTPLEPWALSLPAPSSAAHWHVVTRDDLGQIVEHREFRQGEVGPSLAHVQSTRENGYLLLPPGDEVEVMVHLANSEGGGLGWQSLPIVGPLSSVAARELGSLAWASLGIGFLLIVGLYQLAIFSLRPLEAAPFWLGAFCLTVALYFSVESGILELGLGRSLSYAAGIRLQALLVPVAALHGLMLLLSLAPQYSVNVSRVVGMAVATFISGLVLAAEPAAIDSLLFNLACIYAVFVAGAWIGLTVVRPSVGSREERLWLGLGGVGLCVGGLAHVLLLEDHVSAIGYLPLGLSVWALGVAFVLARRNDDARSMMDSLGAELEAKNLELSELDRLKDDFLAKTSHELRTPLSGVIGLTESLLDGVGGPLEPRLRRNLELIEQSGKRLSHLVNDILDFSKLRNHRMTLERLPVSVFGVVELVVELSRSLVGTKPVSLYNVVGQGLPMVSADPNRLQQILFNLVGNAIKFTEEGYVTIRAQLDEAEENIIISVEDSGIGIALEHRERIFRAFEQGDGRTQREHGGTGLGLAVSQELVRAHGGELGVASALGMGTTMTFSLPVTQAPADCARSAPRHIRAALTQQGDAQDKPAPLEPRSCVLIVDDELVNREVVVLQVEAEGYHAVALEDGARALAWIKQNGAPAVLLLDVMMPGLSGLDMLAQVRKLYSLQELPVLLLTARGTDSNMTEGFAAGANDYLVKPFSRIELMTRLRHHLQFSGMSNVLRETNHLLEKELGDRLDLEGSLAAMRIRQEGAEHNLVRLQSELDTLAKRVARVKGKLLQAEKLASLGQMMAGLAHTLGAPIDDIGGRLTQLRTALDASVSQVTPLLASEHADPEMFKEAVGLINIHFENIEKGVDMVRRITQAMMNYDKRKEESGGVCDITPVISDCLTVCSFRLRGVEVETSLNENCFVNLHRAHLAQVVSNLITNAVDALKDKRQGPTFVPRLRVGMVQESQKGTAGVSICVEDNGMGVPKELEDKIFSPFFTTRSVGEGTGIGLAVSKRIVDDHAGSISVAPGAELGGALFRVWLPLSSPPEAFSHEL